MLFVPRSQLAADIACNRMGDFSPSQLSRLLWCYATLRVCHVDLMKAGEWLECYTHPVSQHN